MHRKIKKETRIPQVVIRLFNGLLKGCGKEKKVVAPLEKKSHAILWYALSIFALISALMVAYVHSRDTRQQQIRELSSLLGDSREQYHIFYGHDGWIYILANNEKKAAWVQQYLIQLHFSKPVKVLNIQNEEERIGSWLAENWLTVKYHRVRIDTPRAPIILISEERNQLNNEKRAQLINNLNKQIPYASQSQLLSISDKEVSYQAESGIKKMAVPYTCYDNGDSVTFIIQGALNDEQLQQLRRFVAHYIQAWGEHYVKFSVELKDDWLKGESFKYGNQGYIKVTPGYWYFPKPL
ncbi:PrgH/EprH family type III secretion apparatus protein [Candidatus Fukatsuia endosymbiont of Drepanosiphum platanoidis]|uniref:PrgH/EprH family type III secretion apparatus protein n=1 Tax=Candidatus Fukatsuia endosymbiont of Drepanosiphum platanoidis TaxID=3077953 RepID=UPI00313D8810